ncbi:Peroxisomal membrane protein pex14 [Thalictrum thalictroides]|uniref:Peroxisomal membrane protein PEX14 n=1 Tax=Thalictrum thalictroides TaxID=46969 RepID=A0A7J6W372_THATH|nr:Peroxisomal membrane protein pex14 [Thalictrum thalictroides]
MGSESATTPTPTPTPNLTDDKPQETTGSEPGNLMTEENAKATSPQSVFVNSEPIREDQVDNAVKFLSHPKVKGSPVMYRRSFLEKKGLTKEEIDEAFRRVPDPSPTVRTTQAASQNQDGQVTSATNLQQQTSAQTPQPVPTGVVSTMTALRPFRFHWSHAFLCLGFLAASGAGTALLFKKSIIPRLKSWIRKVVREEETDSVKILDSKPSVAEEAAAAAKAAAAAAADVAKASLEMLNSKHEERRYFESLRNLLDIQVEEMKSMSKAIQKLEVTKEVGISSIKQTEEFKSRSTNVIPLSAPASVDPSVAPHSKSYMEIMAMVQRGEKPPGIKEINDLPPNPNQPPSNPRLAPRMKPWEISQGQNDSSNGQEYAPSSQLNGDSSEPWWQRKNVRITEIEPETELKASSYRPAVTERLNRSSWVPPQPPPIAMPEAAAAIRQPKPIVQAEQSNGNHLIAHPTDDFEELQRITKISESGDEVNAVPRVTEIQEQYSTTEEMQNNTVPRVSEIQEQYSTKEEIQNNTVPRVSEIQEEQYSTVEEMQNNGIEAN